MLLLLINCIILAVGACGGPLIMRLYFLHGGTRLWLSSWLQSVGFPIIFIPLTIAYIQRRKTQGSNAKLVVMKPIVFYGSAVIGLLAGADSYLYSYGVSKLPVSTATLIISSQLAFTAGFACVLVRQKFTPYSINAVVLLTLGSAVLALDTKGDKPQGESNKDYALGFIMAVGAAALLGLILPLVELTYRKAKQDVSYTLVLEFQLILCVFATIFCTVGMVANNDFKVMSREARDFGLGKAKYYTVIICSAIVWQGNYLGAIGVIYYSSSLFSGILGAALIPVSQVLAVVFYHESFKAEKIVSLLLSLWGSVSYFYGEKRQSHKENKNLDMESPEKTPEAQMTSVGP